MNQPKRWTVIIDIDRQVTGTNAVARLITWDNDWLVGVGCAPRDLADTDVPAIGDELAAARALTELARKLHETADVDATGSGVATAGSDVATAGAGV